MTYRVKILNTYLEQLLFGRSMCGNEDWQMLLVLFGCAIRIVSDCEMVKETSKLIGLLQI